MKKSPLGASLLFLKLFFTMLWALAPLWSGLAIMISGLGAIVGVLEGIGIADGIYFGWVTGATIGYGDIVPTHPLSRFISVCIGLAGIVFTGLVVTIAVTTGNTVVKQLGLEAGLKETIKKTIKENSE